MMQVHALVKKSGEVGSGAMRVARLRYFAAVPAPSLGQAVSLAGSHALDPGTYSFNINDGDCFLIVHDTADYLETLRTITAG